MKILSKNNLMICPNRLCKCAFEYEESDIKEKKFNKNGSWIYTYIHCPSCNQIIPLNSLLFKDKEYDMISFKDKIPNDLEEVVFYTPNDKNFNFYVVGYVVYMDDDCDDSSYYIKCYSSHDDKLLESEPTHWIPLPFIPYDQWEKYEQL